MEPLSKIDLIARCGMNCGLCSGYLRDNNKCPGCRGAHLANTAKAEGVVKRCKIRRCSIGNDDKFCFNCDQYPCKNLKHIDKRYRSKYKMSQIENLEYIKKWGIKKFIEKEKARWTCPKCQGTICIHKGYCWTCKA